MQIDKYTELEHQLGVHEDYEAATWDSTPKYSVYVIHHKGDPVYFGISGDVPDRIKGHKSSVTSSAHKFINERLAEGYALTDLYYVRERHLTQRQAAILELELIYQFRSPTLLNSRAVWTPDFMDDGTRLSQSVRFQGRQLPPEALARVTASNTNTLEFDLYLRGRFVNSFSGISRRDLGKWVETNLDISVPDSSSLWRILTGRRASYKGLTAVIKSGSQCQTDVTELVALRRSITLSPFLVRLPDGTQHAVIGNTSMAQKALGVSAGTLEALLSNRHHIYNGVTARYLTDSEIEKNLNAFKYPAYYMFSIDNSSNTVTRNLNDLCRRYGINHATLNRAARGSHAFSNGQRLTLDLIVREVSPFIKDAILDSRLPTPVPHKMPSDVPGVQYSKSRQSFLVCKEIGGKRYTLKQSKDRRICEEIARYTDALRADNPPSVVVDKARAFAKSFRRKNGIIYRTYETEPT